MSLLLLDLDGVVVFECGPPHAAKIEILRLHQSIVNRLAAFGVPVVVLTHRSRREAYRILESAGIDRDDIAGIAAAEDLALAAWRYGNRWRLFTQGLRKDLILPLIEARYGITRAEIGFLDDRADNLADLLSKGLGLAMHAPSDLSSDGMLTTYDMGEAIAVFLKWSENPTPGKLHALSASEMPIDAWRRTGLSTSRDGRHIFNLLRTTARHVRRAIARR